MRAAWLPHDARGARAPPKANLEIPNERALGLSKLYNGVLRDKQFFKLRVIHR